jgi:hypothetical protein
MPLKIIWLPTPLGILFSPACEVSPSPAEQRRSASFIRARRSRRACDRDKPLRGGTTPDSPLNRHAIKTPDQECGQPAWRGTRNPNRRSRPTGFMPGRNLSFALNPFWPRDRRSERGVHPGAPPPPPKGACKVIPCFHRRAKNGAADGRLPAT